MVEAAGVVPSGGREAADRSKRPAPNSTERSEVVEAAGVELKGRGFANVLMVRDFWCYPVELLAFATTSPLD
jgi:hypothetical protein